MTTAIKACIFCIIGASVALAAVQDLKISPTTRVVELLQSLSKQVEKEGKAEEELYEDFVCWGRNIITQKTAAIAAAESRVDELETYIADLKAGRLEITSERADLEKDIAELLEDMESTTSMRNKEHEDFGEAQDEMDTALTALDDAIDTLNAATKDHKEGVLFAVRASLKEEGGLEEGGMAVLAKRQAALHKAVELGGRFLEKVDAKFLERVLLGQVPEAADAKKLNRKATFKMSYKARSFKIQGVLQKMRKTFQLNLDDAKHTESAALAEYNTLSSSKAKQLDAAREALNKMESENGAKGMSREDSEDEVEALKKQVDKDNQLIKETQDSLDAKATSWKKRQEARSAELAAISKGIAILHNDDSRDLFKKSFASQGFLQVGRTSHKAKAHREQTAEAALRDAALRSGDKRLLTLASGLATRPNPSVKTKFDPVLAAIDNMLVALNDEEDRDLDTKQHCEVDRTDNTHTAIVLSRTIDETTDIVAKLETTIEGCQQKINELDAEFAKTKASVVEAKAMNGQRHLAWLQTNKDDEAAAATVEEARDVLATFYRDKGSDVALLQKRTEQPVDASPPPPTWEGGYGEKTGEAQGIVAILEMVREDILKDLGDAKADDEASAAELAAFEKDSESQMALISGERSRTSDDLGRTLQNKVEEEEQRTADKKSLDSVLDAIKKINPNCEYYEVNYEMRRRNRHIEMDGLNKAKTVLKGGAFDEGPDPEREMQPGDAASSVLLLQGRSRARSRK